MTRRTYILLAILCLVIAWRVGMGTHHERMHPPYAQSNGISELQSPPPVRHRVRAL